MYKWSLSEIQAAIETPAFGHNIFHDSNHGLNTWLAQVASTFVCAHAVFTLLRLPRNASVTNLCTNGALSDIQAAIERPAVEHVIFLDSIHCLNAWLAQVDSTLVCAHAVFTLSRKPRNARVTTFVYKWRSK